MRVRDLLLLLAASSALYAGGLAAAPDPGEPPAEQMFAAHCSVCHGRTRNGGAFGPALRGDAFAAHWKNANDLREFISTKMPPTDPGSLSPQEYSALANYLLSDGAAGVQNASAPQPDARPAAKTYVDRIVHGHVGPIPAKPEVFSDAFSEAAIAQRQGLLARLSAVTEADLAHPAASDWLTWRRSSDFQGFSPLDQINARNVSGLQLAWSWALPTGGNEIAPLVRDGVMFVASGGAVQALDAATGSLLWAYNHKMDAAYKGQANKSIALYGDRIFVATGDRHVVALAARSGSVVWDREIIAADGAAPAIATGLIVAKGRVILGTAPGPACEGSCYILGLDAETGKTAWRFNTIPGAKDPGGDTWNGAPDARRHGLGVWTPPSYDPKTGLIYIGVGGTYDVGPLLETGAGTTGKNDALYSNSTLAIDPDTGRLAWYHQHLKRDIWDLDEAFERILTTLPARSGGREDAILTMGKLGILDVLDRKTGAYRASWDAGLQNVVTAIDPKTGARTFNPALAPRANTTSSVCPSPEGVKNWMASSFDERKSVLYLPLERTCMDYTWRPVTGEDSHGIDIAWSVKPDPGANGDFARIVALDMLTRKPRWVQSSRAPLSSSLLATAGDVLFSGSRDRMFYALDAQSGKRLWSVRLNAAPNATPISYSVNGQQYVAIASGGGANHDRESVEVTPEINDASPSTTIWVFTLSPPAPNAPG